MGIALFVVLPRCEKHNYLCLKAAESLAIQSRGVPGGRKRQEKSVLEWKDEYCTVVLERDDSRRQSRSFASLEPSSVPNLAPYSHLAVSGKLISMLSILAPGVRRPNCVPRSYTRLNST